MKICSGKMNVRYRDRLFRHIFNEKASLLELYNALNDSAYTNPDELMITTIDDIVYIGMKNDLSFLISDVLNLYEHQSTINPNMTIRGLLYFSQEYDAYIERNGLDVYGSKLIKLPTPQYIVFYNGDTDMPERVECSLMDAFEPVDKKPCIECRATVLNINLGKNKYLMEKCRKLYEYAAFVQMVKENTKQGISLQEAISMAVEKAVKQNVLTDILIKNRAEVISMVLTEYDEQRHILNEKNLSFEQGAVQGVAQGADLKAIHYIRTMLNKGLKSVEIAELTEEPLHYVDYISMLIMDNSEMDDTGIYNLYIKEQH